MTVLNALTPVTFVAMYQLLLGNLLLGLIESYLVKSLFKFSVKTTLIVVGNYFSAIVGFLISSALLDNTSLNLIKAYEGGGFGRSILAYTGIALVITIIVEYPFFYFGVGSKSKEKLSFENLFEVILLVHLISYFVTLLSWIILVNLG